MAVGNKSWCISLAKDSDVNALVLFELAANNLWLQVTIPENRKTRT
jgi:hypothetical protein